MTRLRTIAGAIVAACCATLLLLPAPAHAASGSVHISKIYYDSPGTDRGSNSSLNAEYVRITNTRDVSVSLKGWTIRDSAGHKYTFGSFTLAAGEYVTVRTGDGSNNRHNRYQGREWYVWNNDADRATLRRSSGTVVDSCSYDNDDRDYKNC